MNKLSRTMFEMVNIKQYINSTGSTVIRHKRLRNLCVNLSIIIADLWFSRFLSFHLFRITYQIVLHIRPKLQIWTQYSFDKNFSSSNELISTFCENCLIFSIDIIRQYTRVIFISRDCTVVNKNNKQTTTNCCTIYLVYVQNW